MSDEQYVLPMWEDAAVVASFVRWHAAATEYFCAASEALLAAAGVRLGTRLLDVGAGTGIPTLQAAALVGPEGQVVATDPSAGLLAAAEANARKAAVTNVAFRRAPAEALPFPDASFDAVVSQLGLMFVADLPLALAEARRVLRPGGRGAFLTWGSYADNPHWSTFWDIADRYAADAQEVAQVEPEAAPEGEERLPNLVATSGALEERFASEAEKAIQDEADSAPTGETDPRGPFRFAVPGTLSAALGAAGFAAPGEDTLRVDLTLPDPEPIAAFWWEGNPTYEALSPDRQRRFRDEVLAAYRAFAANDRIAVPAVFVLGAGTAL